MIRALTFDADQTLWDFGQVRQRALEATATAMVERGLVPRGTVDADLLQTVRDEIVEGCRGRPHSLEEIREQSFRVVLERAGHPAARSAAHELVELFLDVRFSQIQLYPEVRAVLGRLRGRYRLGLLSNGNSYPDRCGLPDTFDAVVLGPELGVEKPDRRAFEAAAAALAVPLGELAHVGDDADDVDGANWCGAVSVLLSRDGATPASRTAPRFTIRDLTELEDRLELLGAGESPPG